MKKLLFITLLFTSTYFISKAQVNFMWGKQFGTTNEEKARDLTTDKNNNVYVFGKTMGTIGDKNYGKNDGFIVKFDEKGNTKWSVQVGTAEDDDIVQATVDDLGNLYAIGPVVSKTKIATKTNSDMLVVKVSPQGKIMWQKRFGTDSIDRANNIVTDKKGNIFIVGDTKGQLASNSFGNNDCFILQLDADGNQKNIVQFGSPGIDACIGILVKNDARIYVCGYTSGDMGIKPTGKMDVFWGIFSSELKQLQMNQFGTEGNDYAGSIKTDSDENIYIAGSTEGNIGAAPVGGSDAFVCKLDKTGKILWKKQFGSASWDGVNGLQMINDNVVISGCKNYPNCESFCKMYAPDGKLVWTRDFVAQGKGGGTCGKGIQVKADGSIYHAGYTGGNLFTDLKGKHDLFLVKMKLEKN